MRLSDYKNEEALDLFVDLMDPISRIIADEEAATKFDEAPRMEFIKYIIKNHKSEIIQILARVEGTPVEEYECDIFALPSVLLEVLSNPKVLGLFTSQGQKTAQPSSGPATESTTESER